MTKPDDFASQDLPSKRTGGPFTWLGRQGIWKIAFIGFLAYFSIVLIFSGIEYAFHVAGRDLVLNSSHAGVGNFPNIVYFNLITILTVGYGDFQPAFLGKLFSVAEAFLGVGLFSVLVALIITKALLPPRDAIVFSKYAYYCIEPESFLIIFVNTSNTVFGNAEISSYFKLGGDWGVKPSVTSPFITQAVQTFYIDEASREEIIAELREKDCLRVGMTGGLGVTNFSTSIEYQTDRILVIPNRNELTTYEGFRRPNFTSPSFQRMFHYQPEGALTLRAYVEAERRSRAQGE